MCGCSSQAPRPLFHCIPYLITTERVLIRRGRCLEVFWIPTAILPRRRALARLLACSADILPSDASTRNFTFRHLLFPVEVDRSARRSAYPSGPNIS